MTNQNRESKGQPIGGQFAATSRPDGAVQLPADGKVDVLMTDGSIHSVNRDILPLLRGVSAEGYLVVADTFVNTADGEYLYGLTSCCNATAKGNEDGVVCRSCYELVDDALGGEMKPTSHIAGPQSTEDLIAASEADARAEGAELGMVSLVTSQGTAMAEGTLCVECIDDDARAQAWSDVSHDAEATLSPVWASSSGNDVVVCRECGRGAFLDEAPEQPSDGYPEAETWGPTDHYGM